MRARSILLALVMGCGGAVPDTHETTPAQEETPPPAFTTRRALTGPDGVRVTIAEFGENEAYVKLTGVRSPAANFVFRAAVVTEGDRTTYQTVWDGRPFYPIHQEMGSGESRWRAYAPGLSEAIGLEYDEPGSGQVDAAALHAEHVAQTRDGSLTRVQTFDRPAAIAHAEEELAGDLARTEEECGAIPEWSVRWDTASDEVMNRYSVGGYCENILSALRNLCRWEPAKRFVREQVRRIECSWADEWALRIDGGDIAWAVAADATNLQDKARDALLGASTSDGITLQQAIHFAETDVCMSADESHVVVVHPHHRDASLGISYGTAQRLFHTPQSPDLMRGWFFEPRQFHPRNNSGFRGFDLRYFSRVEADREANTCKLLCGERETTWTLLPADRTRALLQAAETVPSPFNREPYALARDQQGSYYYVDRGATEDTRRDFRVFRGRRGRMEQLEMRDIASDSEGEVFSTASGDLRLVVDNQEGAQWIRGARPLDLRRVPVQENYRLIMNELGVYVGERFELPCDDY